MIKNIALILMLGLVTACDGGDTTEDSGTTEDTDTTEDTSPTADQCATFCGDYETTCGAEVAWATCAADCEGLALGEAGATSGDTFECRVYHLSVAADDAATHCPHAAADGANVCVD